MMKSTRIASILSAALFAALVIPAASADFIPVSDSPGSEYSHIEILEGAYSPGSAWVAMGSRIDPVGNAIDWTNGTLSAIRVDDSAIGGVMNTNFMSPGSATDQLWTGGPVSAIAQARYAGFSQEFGYRPVGGDYVKLMDVSGYGLGVSGSGTLNGDPTAVWSWIRDGSGQQYSSDNTLNSDGLDHLVTYQLSGFNDGLNHWLLCWEDLPNLGDADYNDLVVEVTAAVPEPGTVGLILAGAIGGLARRR